MTLEQKEAMLQYVALGYNWDNACSKADIPFGQFFNELYTGQNTSSGPAFNFVKRLEAVGYEATQKELASLRNQREPILTIMEL